MPGHFGCPNEGRIETAVLASWVEGDFSAKLSQTMKWHRVAGWAGYSGLRFRPDLAVVPMTHQSYFPGLDVFVLENGRGKEDSLKSLLLKESFQLVPRA